MTTRRGFLQSILALAAAPAIVRADSLMRIVPRQFVVAPMEIGYLQNFLFIESDHRVDALAYLLRDIEREVKRLTGVPPEYLRDLNFYSGIRWPATPPLLVEPLVLGPRDFAREDRPAQRQLLRNRWER